VVTQLAATIIFPCFIYFVPFRKGFIVALKCFIFVTELKDYNFAVKVLQSLSCYYFCKLFN